MLFPRSALAGVAACLAVPLFAGPALTTVQDTFYRADGTPYNGIAIITWTPFVAGDTSNIATQSVTATISGGHLFVQLVPSTNAAPAGYYTVTYTSSGNDQFSENWAVAPSNVPLRLADVRMSPAPVQAQNSMLEESDVAGLVADLAIRPVKGSSYTPGRAAFIDAGGGLNGVSGSASNCVHVDGSSGPCGSGTLAASPSFIDGEALSGVVDGSNAAFTIAAAPAPVTSLAIYRNGMRLKVGQDFTISGSTVQFVVGAVPQPGDTLLASYRVTPAGAPQGPVAPLVLCAGAGTATSSTSATTLGTCNIPAGTLQAGDRVRISFDYSHEGSFAGITVILKWGNTIISQRSGGASDSLISGWAEVGVGTSSSQLTVQTWGTLLPFSAGVVSAGDSIAYPLVLALQAKMAAAASDTATLRNFSVVRYPKVP